MPVLLVPFVLLCPILSYGGQSEPSNYDECILDAMRGVSSDVAARAIIDSCRNLFPKEPQEVAPQAAPAPVPASTPAPAEEPPPPAAAAIPVVPAAAPVTTPLLDTSGARNLTDDELGRLRATAKVFGDSYRVTVVNNNPNLTLTEVTIAVWDDSDGGATRQEHRETVQIGPQSSELVNYTVRYRGDEVGWRWDVVGARGVE